MRGNAKHWLRGLFEKYLELLIVICGKSVKILVDILEILNWILGFSAYIIINVNRLN